MRCEAAPIQKDRNLEQQSSGGGPMEWIGELLVTHLSSLVVRCLLLLRARLRSEHGREQSKHVLILAG